MGLIIVAAGVLSNGVHDLQIAGLLPGLDTLAFDVSEVIVPGSLVQVLLAGVFHFSPATTWLEVVVWTAYAVPVACLLLRPQRERIRVRVPVPSAVSPPSS